MIVVPVKKNSKHFERQFDRFVYRYGYQTIPGDDDYVSAVVEETKIRLTEPVIRKKVTDYCKSVNIPNEYEPSDYGY